MKPDDFHYLATNLVNNGLFPAEFRTAVSRAYYAAFNLGVDLLDSMGFPLRGQFDVHAQVYRYFHNSGNPRLMEAARRLQELKTSRKHADYDLNRTDVEKKDVVRTLVMSAGRVIETLRDCCNGPARNDIKKAIQQWKQNPMKGK